MESKSAKSLTCPDCGGDFSAADLLDGDSFVTCLSCGKKFRTSDILRQSNDEKMEEIRAKAYTEVEKDRTQAYRDVEEGKRQIERERMQHEFAREEKEEKEKQVKVFKKSKLRIAIMVLMIFSAMICAVAFKDGKIVAGIIAVIMTGLFILCFLIGLGIIPEKIKGLQIIAFIVACILFLPCTFIYTFLEDLELSDPFTPSATQMSEISWPRSDLAQLVPVPKSLFGKIEWEMDYGFVIYIGNTTKEEYKEYVDECWDAGFNIDYHRSDKSFWADNVDGHNLIVQYEGNDIIFIRIDAKGHGFNT